jgi:cyclopropane-fatty-acyl-phospholipid synthase
MGLLTLEHSKAAYRADFAFYGGAIMLLGAGLVVAGPPGERAPLLMLALIGMTSWSALEYLLHRFVLHGVQPFKGWHAAHHARPHALICAPTIMSASLILVLVFLPSLAMGNVWRAGALTLGILIGYLSYAITHHATHHWRADTAWLRERKRWHALHHQPLPEPGCYGVTSNFWDQVFGTARARLQRQAR